MKRIFLRRPICLVGRYILTLLLLNAPGVSSTCVQDESKAGAIMVTYCDLLNDAGKNDGKLVRVRATYRYGFEWQEMFCLGCRDRGKTWLEFDTDSDRELRGALKRLPKDQGTVNAIFEGTLTSTDGPFGDGGYRFKFVAKSISDVSVISKSGANPEQLPIAAQKNICGYEISKAQ